MTTNKPVTFPEYIVGYVPTDTPAGRVLVHNAVYPVANRCGIRGSRFWWASVSEVGTLYQRCDCPWEPERQEGHYRNTPPLGEGAHEGDLLPEGSSD